MTSEQVQFQEFFTAHYPRLRRLGYWLTGSWVEAEDLAQEAMVRTFWRWRIVRRHDRPEEYARKVLVSRHRSLLRRAVVRARHAARADDAAPIVASDPTDALVLWEATRRLPVPGLDEPGAFDRFRRRRVRKTVVTGGVAVLMLAAGVALTVAGVQSWSGPGGSVVGPVATGPSSRSPATSVAPTTRAAPDLRSPEFQIRPLGPVRAVASTAAAGRRWTLVVQRGRYLDRPGPGPVTCMAVLPAPRVPRFADDGGGCQPESHPGSPFFDLGLGYGPPPGRMANGLAGSVPRSAVRVRVLGRCGWEPAETDALDAGPESPARFFLVPPQRKGVPDVVLALDAGGRQVGRQAILPPGTDCRGTPTSP